LINLTGSSPSPEQLIMKLPGGSLSPYQLTIKQRAQSFFLIGEHERTSSKSPSSNQLI
jgi:hypothetical protein